MPPHLSSFSIVKGFFKCHFIKLVWLLKISGVAAAHFERRLFWYQRKKKMSSFLRLLIKSNQCCLRGKTLLVLKPWSSPDRFIVFNQTCGQNKSHRIFHSSTSHLPPKVNM